MKRALITGASGFIGYHLSNHLLKHDMEITIIDNLSRGRHDIHFASMIENKNINFINMDMTDTSFCEQLSGRYDYIYHLAAINGTKNFYNIPYKVLKVNILSLLNLLEWCTPENCGSFLFTSSSEAYAGTINHYSNDDLIPTNEKIPLTVDDVFNPRFSYGGSKLTGELLTINYCRTNAIPFKIVRYHNIYGPRMGYDHVLPEFIHRILQKENPFNVFGGDETRAFCFVDDAVKATEAVMLSEKCIDNIIHIGNSTEEISIINLLTRLFSIIDYKAEINIKPAPEGCVKRRCPDINKLITLTGFTPKITLDEGLPIMYDWYKNDIEASC